MQKNVTLIFLIFFLSTTVSCKKQQNSSIVSQEKNNYLLLDYVTNDTLDIIAKADFYLSQEPTPITSFICLRSQGSIHDFYSEGDYWWQNPEDPEGPYIRKDGYSNPSNFNDHRKAMRDLNLWISHLVSAYILTGDERYASHALKHLNAFFLDPNTKMNPSLLYAQAIKGIHSGRGIGIIDTIHLIEIARAIKKLEEKGFLQPVQANGLKQWFEDYATWMNTHQYGLDEKDHGNNHSTWWAAQIAVFADLVGRKDLTQVAIVQFKKLLDTQMAENGSFPEELGRTKPYNYSLFNLEAYSLISHVVKEEDLWNYQSKNGSLRRAWEFMIPFIVDKSSWIKPPDIEHFDELPLQSCGLLFAGIAYDNEKIIQTWKNLSPEKKSEEMIRTFPLWQPILWIN